MIRRICVPPNTSSNESSKHNLAQQPPKPIPSKCCIGSSSQGGQVTFKPHVCNLGLESYLRAERHALEHLKNHPINDSISSNETSTASCDVCRIVEVLARNNWTMTFQGDSTMHQLADAFECALRRRGYRIETEENPWRRPHGLFWRYGIGSAMRMRVWPPSTGDRASDETSSPVIIRYYGMYRPNFGDNSSEIYHVMERSDVLVFDHGLHYTKDQDKVFLSEMTKLLGTIYQKKDKTSMLNTRKTVTTAVKTPKVIAWKETVSQHFDTPTGDYVSASRTGVPEGCVKHPTLRNSSANPQPDQLTWYQDYMMRITQEMGIGLISPDNINSFSSIRMGDGLSHGDTSLFVLPFTKYTRSLHYLHPGGSDCTHICYTPFVWMPMWRSLRRILDSVASDHKHQGHSYVATFVVSDLRFMLGKMNIRNLGLFFCGAVLLFKFHGGKAHNGARFGRKRILLVVGIVLAIGISAIGPGDMRIILQSMSSSYY